MFASVSASKKHVSVELDCGARFRETFGHLEGAGKGRRHTELHSPKDLKAKELALYLQLALEAARRSA